jgi:hypothetical protein
MARDSQPPLNLWPWMLLPWAFFGLIAYYLLAEHRVHAYGALPYVIAIVLVAVPFAYVYFRRHRHAKPRRG